MKTIEVTKNPLVLKEWLKHPAKDEHAEIEINEDTLITENGKPIILYKVLDVDTKNLKWAVNTIEYNESTRTSGLKTRSAIFGYSPRIAIRNNFCSATAMARNYAKQHKIICDFGQKLISMYQEHFPNVYEEHIEKVKENVKPEWVIKDTPFTSGIVNQNNALNYHLDAGNFKDVLSNMIVFKKGIRGGKLICPEYNLKFAVDDNSLMIFDGQSILHGVSEIKKMSPNAMRYSIVYYSLEQMWQCLDVEEEIERVREIQTKREEKRKSGNN